KLAGGERISAAAPINRLPLFVKAGSIIPTTEVVEYSAASAGMPLTIDVYPGKDATFTLYDDAGDSYDFEKGECTRIRMDWNDAKGILTVSDAQGTYPDAPAVRKMTIRKGDKSKTIKYKGKSTKIKL
ncbi:MAG: DUF5110 domain-containing protein, partial [Muribaculaceae bacterium]|nr:DUF5110 domain-containing protein [Muribaculaceae bacterium]